MAGQSTQLAQTCSVFSSDLPMTELGNCLEKLESVRIGKCQNSFFAPIGKCQNFTKLESVRTSQYWKVSEFIKTEKCQKFSKLKSVRISGMISYHILGQFFYLNMI